MLFDDVIGSGNERWRNGDAERPRGLQIDHEFKFVWVLDGKIGWLGAFQDAIDIGSRAPNRSVGSMPYDISSPISVKKR